MDLYQKTTNPNLLPASNQTPGPISLQPSVEPDEWEGLNLTVHHKVRDAVKQVVTWYQSFNGIMILAGGCGCGKTHLAKVVYDKADGPAYVLDWDAEPIESVRNAIFYAEPDFFADIRQTYSNGGKAGQTEGEIVRLCQRARLLILDDLGVAHIRDESLPWAQDLYWRILDARADKPTLITTNLKIEQVPARIGKRAFSRLMGGMGKTGYADMFGVPDYRLKDWQRGLGQ